MRMRYSPMSPFVRKARVTAHEVGVADRIELVPTDVWNPKTGLDADNPLEKIPTLILDDGRVLFDSPFICEYLDAELGDGSLFPPPGPARWAAFRLQALGDGIADARSEEHTSELQSLMRISYAVFCLKKKKMRQNTDQ